MSGKFHRIYGTGYDYDDREARIQRAIAKLLSVGLTSEQVWAISDVITDLLGAGSENH